MESEESDVLNKKRSNHCQRKMEARRGAAKLVSQLEEQFTTGRLYGKASLHKFITMRAVFIKSITTWVRAMSRKPNFVVDVPNLHCCGIL